MLSENLSLPGLRAVAVVLATMGVVGCGSGSSDDDEGAAGSGGSASSNNGNAGAGTIAGFLACPVDTPFHLVGEVGGEVVEITEAPATGGFSQGSNPPGPHFRVPNSESEDDEQLIVVFLTWSDVAASDEVTPVEGWLRLPLGAPFPGETICAGAGSEMVIPVDDDTVGDFHFRLRELAGGADCSEPLSGELRGCWRH